MRFYLVKLHFMVMSTWEYSFLWWTWLRQQDAQGCGCDKWEDDTISSTVM